MAKTTPYFFEYGFIGLANDKAIQHFCGLGKIILIYNHPFEFLIISFINSVISNSAS